MRAGSLVRAWEHKVVKPWHCITSLPTVSPPRLLPPLGAGGQPGSPQGALPPPSPTDERPAGLSFSPVFGEKPEAGSGATAPCSKASQNG